MNKDNIKQFINAVSDERFSAAEDAFKVSIADKINSALQQKKIEVAGKIYSKESSEENINEISFNANLKLIKNLPASIRKEIEKMAKKQNVKIRNDKDLLNYIFNDEDALDIAAEYLDV